MFDVGRSKKCFNLPLTSIFYSRRNGRTFLGPPPEVEGLVQTKRCTVSGTPHLFFVPYTVNCGPLGILQGGLKDGKAVDDTLLVDYSVVSVPIRSSILVMPCSSQKFLKPSIISRVAVGFIKLAVPTWTARAPAMRNSSASR